ncbi:hypothetical protein MMC11_003140 [Xylographa trunciseda]|nr:hypothetical protein [Xylographa trunciseda]
MPDNQSRFDLPGHNLPLDFIPPPSEAKSASQNRSFLQINAQGLFPNALDGNTLHEGSAALRLTTVRELMMLRIMNHITDIILGWQTKVFDDTIVSSWKKEILAWDGFDCSEKMIEWIVKELQYKAALFAETGALSIYNGDVVKADLKVPECVKEMLKREVRRLEEIPEFHKDYHPGSEGRVLDIVHPSLWPLIYGRSRMLTSSLVGLSDSINLCGQGMVLPIPPEPEEPDDLNGFNAYSTKFQWLPCEVEFVDQSDKVKITSYINNLHPKDHADLYTTIADIIALVVPLWNMTLTPLKLFPQQEFIRIANTNGFYKHDVPMVEPEPDESPEDFDARYDAWELDSVSVIQPEPAEFKVQRPAAKETVNLRRDFGHRGLQVIVKLANIHLDPEKPEYMGGTWHVEGQMNEHICATALYYYDSQNITESRLAFRQQCDGTHRSDQDHDHKYLVPIFGCEPGPALQYVGDVVCKEDRIVTFPNVLQHCVCPFRLQDATKPGHRKIVALFLVDPNIRIISTANVPPQQKHWWGAELSRTGVFGRLPTELQTQIIDDVEDFPIGTDEAKKLRLKLMNERKSFARSQECSLNSFQFDLCEH